MGTVQLERQKHRLSYECPSIWQATYNVGKEAVKEDSLIAIKRLKLVAIKLVCVFFSEIRSRETVRVVTCARRCLSSSICNLWAMRGVVALIHVGILVGGSMSTKYLWRDLEYVKVK